MLPHVITLLKRLLQGDASSSSYTCKPRNHVTWYAASRLVLLRPVKLRSYSFCSASLSCACANLKRLLLQDDILEQHFHVLSNGVNSMMNTRILRAALTRLATHAGAFKSRLTTGFVLTSMTAPLTPGTI